MPKLLKIEELILDEGEECDKFALFNQWCEKEGVIMPKVTYPAFFEGGLIGAKCNEDI